METKKNNDEASADFHPEENNDKKKWYSDLIPGRPDRNLFKDGEDEAPIDKDRKFVSQDPYDEEEGDEDYDDETTEGGNYFEKQDDSEKVRK